MKPMAPNYNDNTIRFCLVGYNQQLILYLYNLIPAYLSNSFMTIIPAIMNLELMCYCKSVAMKTIRYIIKL